MGSPEQLIDRLFDLEQRRRLERLESEAKAFLAMGYKPEELVKVTYPSMEEQIQPKQHE